MSRAFIHLPEKLLQLSPPGGGRFYPRLHEALAASGHSVEYRRRTSLHAGSDYAQKGVHFVHQGLVRQPGVLNTGVAYIYPFWYADPRGIFAESSIAEMAFDPETVDPQAARGFFARLQRRLIGQRISKYDQPETSPPIPEGCIAVFLQGPSLPVLRARHMTEIEMIDAILAHAGDRDVVVKPHPRTADPEVMRHLSGLEGRENLHVVEANVHDMLAAAAVTCSISSSVSLEGMVHEVPALLFGCSDFHHIARTVEGPGAVAPALDWALSRPKLPYAAYLHWFLQENCINMGREDWFARIKARMATVQGLDGAAG